jgi:nucleoside-diphosphate-sugar epimerase
VTGALGCIGAWTLKALLSWDEEPVGFDVGTDPYRLRQILDDAELDRIRLVQGDVTDVDVLTSAIDDHGVTRVIHLAAMQVPLCRADPMLGAHANVLGTVAVFEAIKGRRERINGLVYASSVAVYNSSDPSPAPETGGAAPATLYGVYKLANEGTARMFWLDARVPSIGIRPYVVYGPGRDYGMTSGPTLAMNPAARGEAFAITYGGIAQYDFAPVVGEAFARASRSPMEDAHVANFPGVPASMGEVVAAIERAAPEAKGMISWSDEPLPFPALLETGELERLIGAFPQVPLDEGVRRTVEFFRVGESSAEASA